MPEGGLIIEDDFFFLVPYHKSGDHQKMAGLLLMTTSALGNIEE